MGLQRALKTPILEEGSKDVHNLRGINLDSSGIRFLRSEDLPGFRGL